MMSSQDLGLSMLTLEKSQENQNQGVTLISAKFLIFTFVLFFFSIIFIVKDRRVGEELETGWLKIIIPMREVL